MRYYQPILFTLALILLGLFFLKTKNIISPLVVSVTLYFLLKPIVDIFDRIKIGKKLQPTTRRSIAILFVYIFVSLILIVLINLMVPPIVEQMTKLGKNLPNYAKQWEQFSSKLLYENKNIPFAKEFKNIPKVAVENIVNVGSHLIQTIIKNTGKLFSQIVLFVFVPFITFYLLLYPKEIKEAIILAVPKKYREELVAIINEIINIVDGYIKGQVILCIIMGTVTAVGLWLLGVKAPLFLGVIAAITKAIPVVGIFIAGIPASLIALTDSTVTALYVILLFTIVQLLENKIILPQLLSLYVHLSPLTILLGLMAGEEIGGIWGMLVATPIVATLKVIFEHIQKRYNQ